MELAIEHSYYERLSKPAGREITLKALIETYCLILLRRRIPALGLILRWTCTCHMTATPRSGGLFLQRASGEHCVGAFAPQNLANVTREDFCFPPGGWRGEWLLTIYSNTSGHSAVFCSEDLTTPTLLLQTGEPRGFSSLALLTPGAVLCY